MDPGEWRQMRGTKPSRFGTMGIRTKALLAFLALSLLPLLIVGSLAYRYGHEVVEEDLGSSFQQIAHEVLDKVDRGLYAVYDNAQSWAGLEVMQQVLTGDLDGRISSLLMGLSKEHGYFSSVNALNREGQVVASSNPRWIGKDVSREPFYQETVGGAPHVGDVAFDKVDQEWVVTFAFPVKAAADESVIGVLCAKWKASGLSEVAQVMREQGEKRYRGHLMLMRRDGLVISAPEFEKADIFKRSLLETRLKSARLASDGEKGYLVEIDEHSRRSLIGYDFSRGYREFPGLGWAALVVEDVKTAFAPVERLKMMLLGVAAGMVVFAMIVSFLVARSMARPILQISQSAERVAQGDFEARADYASGDEIGALSQSFNKMLEDLKAQRAQLVDKDYVDSIIASMVDTLLVVGPDGKLKTVNQATCQLLGYAEDELIGQDVGVIFAEEEDTPFKGTWLKRLVEEGSLRDYERTYRTKSGEKIPVSFSGSVVRGEDGAIVGIVGIARDMREMKRLMQKGKELAAATAAAETEKQRAAELLKAYEELREKSARLERFQRVTVGRELKMIQLKKEVNALLERLGQPQKYEAKVP